MFLKSEGAQILRTQICGQALLCGSMTVSQFALASFPILTSIGI